MKKALFILFLTVSTKLSYSQLYTEVDTTQIKIGQPINYILTVPLKPNDKIELPVIRDTLSYHIEVLNQKIDTVYQGENKNVQLKLQLTSYESGSFLIRTLPVIINQDTLLSQSYQIKVLEVKIDSTNLQGFPIKSIESEEYTLIDYWNKYWLYLAAIAVVLVIGLMVLILYLLEKKRNKKALEPPKTPYEEAIAKLKELDKKDYLSKPDVKSYYSTLSYIIKNYLGRRFKFSSLELLSDELIHHLEKENYITNQELKELSLFLAEADLVKFAKSTPSQEKHQTYRKLIENLVENTKPIISEEIEQIDLPQNYRKKQ